MANDDADAALAEELLHVAAVSNAVMAAMKFDGTLIARGLLVIAKTMVANDPAGRTVLGKEMIQAALELDRDLTSVRLQ